MPDIGVVVALPKEAATLGVRSGRAAGRASANGLRVAIAGVGAQRAEAAARNLLDAGVGALLSWGVAGGLATALQSGDLVLADKVCASDREVPADSAWNGHLAQALRAAGLELTMGPVWSHAGAVTSVLEKQQLAAQGYMAVDMESIGVARVADAAKLPFAALKCICDPSGRALPADAGRWLRPDGRVRPLALTLALARGPRLWRALRDMQRDFNAACSGLRGAADALRLSWPA